MMNPRSITLLSLICLGLLTLTLYFFPSPPAHSFQVPASDACYVYPSPATGDTAWVVYNMPAIGTALVLIYNESGDLVAQVQESKPAGPQQQTGLNLFYYRRGVYFCRVFLTLENGDTKALKTFKFVVIR